jgi:hypothetical protein
VDTSLVGGLDIVAGQESNPMPWNTYIYSSERDSVIGISYDREILEPLGGVAGTVLDLIMDNTDKRFTPGFDSTIGTALTSNRPCIVDVGFDAGGAERTVPVFSGVTFSDVEPDFMSRKALIRSADMITLLDQTTLAAAIYEDKRSDEIIQDILEDAGFGSTQFELDTGLNTIPFAWFPASMHALARVRKVCEAEEASFYQDERGKVRFETRLHVKNFPHKTTQITLYGRHMLEFSRVQSSTIINRCVVKSFPRDVDADNSTIWTSPEEITVDGNGSREYWARFTDETTSVPLLANSLLAPVADTDYTAFTATGGGGSDITADQTVTVENFVESAKITITNGNASTAYFNLLQLRGKAARVVKSIQAVKEDANSQNKYGIQELVIRNDFIQDVDWAEAFANDMVQKDKDANTVIIAKIPGLPHLQLKDKVDIVDPDLNTTSSYRVMRIRGKFIPGSFTQDVTLRAITSNETAT